MTKSSAYKEVFFLVILKKNRVIKMRFLGIFGLVTEKMVKFA